MFRWLLAVAVATVVQAAALEYYGPQLERYTYPFEVRHLELRLQEQPVQMAYMDLKPEKPNGRCIVLLHGKNFTGAYWERTARTLAGAGYRVVIPDQIGFGKSSKPVGIQYSFSMLARNTAALLEHLGISRSVVLGHSMGGMLAVRYALSYPDRVEALVLENPIGLEDWQRFAPDPGVAYWYGREKGKTVEKIMHYQLESYYDNRWKPEYQPWADLLASLTLGGDDYEPIARNQALVTQMIYTQPVCHQFDQLHLPVLLIIGQRDRTALGKELVTPEVRGTMGNYPLLGRQAAGVIPGARLVELPGIGHLPHIESFPLFMDALTSFLNAPRQ